MNKEAKADASETKVLPREVSFVYEGRLSNRKKEVQDSERKTGNNPISHRTRIKRTIGTGCYGKSAQHQRSVEEMD